MRQDFFGSVTRLQWDLNCHQRAYRHGRTSIGGSRGVRFSSPTEEGIDDWYGFNM